MQINPLASANIATNSNYAAIGEAASDASFAQMLNELKTKAAASADPHVVNGTPSSQKDKELKEACKGFEAMFLNMMYREMRATVPENTLFGESNAMKIFEDMRDTELTKKIADIGGIGLGDLIYKQLAPTVLAREEAEANMKTR